MTKFELPDITALVQPSEGGKFTPTLSLMNNKGLHFYYAERIGIYDNMIYRYQIKAAKLEEMPLVLKSNCLYDLNRAVMSGSSSFVMPYYRKNHVGLVRVKM